MQKSNQKQSQGRSYPTSDVNRLHLRDLQGSIYPKRNPCSSKTCLVPIFGGRAYYLCLADPLRFELRTIRLTAGDSTAELRANYNPSIFVKE